MKVFFDLLVKLQFQLLIFTKIYSDFLSFFAALFHCFDDVFNRFSC